MVFYLSPFHLFFLKRILKYRAGSFVVPFGIDSAFVPSNLEIALERVLDEMDKSGSASFFVYLFILPDLFKHKKG